MCSEGGGKDLFREVHRQSGSISSEAPQEGEHFAEENRQLGGPWRGGGVEEAHQVLGDYRSGLLGDFSARYDGPQLSASLVTGTKGVGIQRLGFWSHLLHPLAVQPGASYFPSLGLFLWNIHICPPTTLAALPF